jgi:hypothetical protein
LFPPLDLADGDRVVELPSDFARIDDLERPDVPRSAVPVDVRLKPARGRDSLRRLIFGQSARTATLSKLLNTAGVTLRSLKYTLADADPPAGGTSAIGHRETTHAT